MKTISMINRVKMAATSAVIVASSLVIALPQTSLAAENRAAVEVKAESSNSSISASAILLGTTTDQCSGQLYVRTTSGTWKKIPRGVWTTVSVKVDANGFWQWKCGATLERSRVTSLPIVKTVKVYHSLTNRGITWKAYL